MRDGGRIWRNPVITRFTTPERLAWLFALLVCGAVFGITGWRLVRAHDVERHVSRVATANLARSLAEHADATVQDADIVLVGLVERLQSEEMANAALARLHRFLMARVARIPTIHHLVIFSADGNAQTASFEPMPPVNIADRSYFTFHRDHPDAGLLIGPPMRNRADGNWSLMASRRFNRADGTFGGVVVAVIECDTFARFFRSFDVGAHGSITLLNDSNMIVVREPQPLDPDFRDKPTTQDIWSRGVSGNGRFVSSVDGVTRLFSYQKAERTPLMVIVALSEQDVFAVWRRDAWIAVAACSVVSATLSLLGWWLGRQIRHREKREHVLRLSEERYRLLADYGRDVVVQLGPDRRRRYVSPASERLLGYRPDELLNDYPGSDIHHDDWPIVEDAMDEIFRSGQAPAVNYRIRRKDGSYVWVEALGQKLENDQGIIVSLRDATGRKEAESLLYKFNNRLSSTNAELERLARHLAKARDGAELASKAKSRFLASISHELRTPLNGILGYAQLLRREGGLNIVQAERVQAMLGAGEHLLQMINQVLDFSEIESGHGALRLSPIDPREVACACLELVRPSADAKELRLDFVAEPSVALRVTTDPTRLRQVLLNLLGNAVKFTARGGVDLRLSTTPQGDRLRFEVADTGPGIPAGRRDRLFQEFERLDAGIDGAVEGAGLGLALSARVMAMMGGSLGHENPPEGAGSVFWLEVPVVSVEVDNLYAQQTQPNTSGAAPVPARTLRVLVVDDMPMNRDIAGAFLRAAGHVVAYAEGGLEAVEAVGTTAFDVVLMDVRMPEVDGLEATRRIRALDGPCADVPIVALTAQAYTEQVDECLHAGMDSHLAKPFTPEALMEALAWAAAKGVERGKGKSIPLGKLSGRAKTVPAVELDSELPVFDRNGFDRTAAFLDPKAIVSFLQTIAERAEALQRALSDPQASIATNADLAEAAHTLSGSCGMFGFARLASVARRLERALQTSAPETPALAAALADVIVASLEAMPLAHDAVADSATIGA